MRKLLVILAIFGCLALVAGPARADMVAVSVNFTNSSNLLAAGDVAGNAANRTAFANWNNMTSGNTLTGMVYSNGEAATGLVLTTSLDSWNTNVDIQNSAGTPSTGGANDKLMRAGGWTGGTGAGSPANSNHQITFTNLNALFPNGYVIYLYQDAAYNNQVAQWGGNSVVAPATGVVFSNGGISTGSNANFVGDWASQNHQVEIYGTGATLITGVDTLTINQNCLAYSTGPISSMVITGIQIVGEVSFLPPVAEPAGLGMIGVALLALKKRRS